MDYNLVPERDSDGNETGYYTREPDGVSGMTISALAEFCGLAAGSTTAISNLLDRIKAADPETNDLPESLKDLAGKDLRLETNDPSGRLLIQDEACFAIAEYYAFDARAYEGKSIAVRNYRTVGRPGMRVFIWSRTGYVPPEFRQQSKVFNSYTLERISLHHSDTTLPLPDGYFSCFDKMIEILQRLDVRLGYQLGEQWYDRKDGVERYLEPDISLGRHFSQLFSSNYPDAEARFQSEFESRSSKPRIRNIWNQGLIDLKWKADRALAEQQLRVKHLKSPHSVSESAIDRQRYCFKPAPNGNRPDTLEAYCYSNDYTSLFSDWLRQVFFRFCWKAYITERDLEGWMMRYERFKSLPGKDREAILKTSEGGMIAGFEFLDSWKRQLPHVNSPNSGYKSSALILLNPPYQGKATDKGD